MGLVFEGLDVRQPITGCPMKGKITDDMLEMPYAISM
jgi:hypothetical protein